MKVCLVCCNENVSVVVEMKKRIMRDGNEDIFVSERIVLV
jgi:hypothetical protein